MSFLKKFNTSGKRLSTSKDGKQSLLTVVINSPDKTVWEGKAYSVSSRNLEGDFDVLPMHSNFVTVLEDQPIIIDSVNEGRKKFSFASAVMYVVKNRVRIYVNI